MRADDEPGSYDERPVAEHVDCGRLAQRLECAVVRKVGRELVDRVFAERRDGTVLVHRAAEVRVHGDARDEAVEPRVGERLRGRAHDVRDVAAGVDHRVPLPAVERSEIAVPVAGQPLDLRIQLRVGATSVEERQLVTFRQGRVDDRPAEKPGPAEDE